MNLWVVLRFLFGNEQAVKAVAQSAAALPFGVCLVLLTAVARNYDQNFITETPLWLFGPLLFSFFSGAWLFFILYNRCVKRFLAAERLPALSDQWRSFMGLFWMTAPVAWLYAIPVERFLDPIGAAKANITLLAGVSVWRVLLMSRVICVINAVPFLRSLAWVLVAAALEVIAVVFLGGFFDGSFSKRILAGMSGMRNAPDETMLLNALGVSWNGAWIVLLVTLVLLAMFRYQGTTVPFPAIKSERIHWLTLVALSVLWFGIAWPAQQKQRRFQQHAKLIAAERYARAIEILSAYRRSDFPASRRLEPNPYEYRVWDDLPATVALMTTNTPVWIRETYFNHLAATFQHPFSRYDSLTNVAKMYSALSRLPESREWLRTNQVALARQQVRQRRSDPDEASERQAWTNILVSLRMMGMAETNLARLAD